MRAEQGSLASTARALGIRLVQTLALGSCLPVAAFALASVDNCFVCFQKDNKERRTIANNVTE
jgi:hypothetical protein